MEIGVSFGDNNKETGFNTIQTAVVGQNYGRSRVVGSGECARTHNRLGEKGFSFFLKFILITDVV